MKTPSRLALGMQAWLCTLSHDCYCADAFTSGLVDVLDAKARWQAAVDTIYRFVISGLMAAGSANGHMDAERCREYIDELARNNPFSGDPDEDIVWCRFDFCLTPGARALIEKHRLRDSEGELNEPFINEIERLFELSGVGWTHGALIPIQAI